MGFDAFSSDPSIDEIHWEGIRQPRLLLSLLCELSLLFDELILPYMMLSHATQANPFFALLTS